LQRQLKRSDSHRKYAPYWAIGLLLLVSTGLSTIWIDLGSFWNGYLLDMAGPAWNYILFRGLFTEPADNKWTRFFTAKMTLAIFIAVCIIIECAQHLNLYDATYDPWDFLAYVSILIPMFLLDSYLSR